MLITSETCTPLNTRAIFHSPSAGSRLGSLAVPMRSIFTEQCVRLSRLKEGDVGCRTVEGYLDAARMAD